MTMQKITLTNDFHNSTATIHVPSSGIISTAQWDRAVRKLCGIKECTCGGIRGEQEWLLEPVYKHGQGVGFRPVLASERHEMERIVTLPEIVARYEEDFAWLAENRGFDLADYDANEVYAWSTPDGGRTNSYVSLNGNTSIDIGDFEPNITVLA